jgi:hypothetical protein
MSGAPVNWQKVRVCDGEARVCKRINGYEVQARRRRWTCAAQECRDKVRAMDARKLKTVNRQAIIRFEKEAVGVAGCSMFYP